MMLLPQVLQGQAVRLQTQLLKMQGHSAVPRRGRVPVTGRGGSAGGRALAAASGATPPRSGGGRREVEQQQQRAAEAMLAALAEEERARVGRGEVTAVITGSSSFRFCKSESLLHLAARKSLSPFA